MAIPPGLKPAWHYAGAPKTLITIQVDSIEVGGKGFEVDIKHRERIREQTGLVALTGTLSLKVFLFDIQLSGERRKLYSWMLYERREGRWHELSAYTLYSLHPGEYMNGWQGVGHRGTPEAVFFKCTITFT
jgi:hypothetical protein